MSKVTENDGKAGQNDNDGKCGCYSVSRKEFCPPLRNITHPLRYYEFTQDEIRALEECDRESFYRRCIPLSTLFAALTYTAMRRGFVKKNPYFGVYPKVLSAVVVGYVTGKLAYMYWCDRIFRKLPAGNFLGETMRRYHHERLCRDKVSDIDSKGK